MRSFLSLLFRLLSWLNRLQSQNIFLIKSWQKMNFFLKWKWSQFKLKTKRLIIFKPLFINFLFEISERKTMKWNDNSNHLILWIFVLLSFTVLVHRFMKNKHYLFKRRIAFCPFLRPKQIFKSEKIVWKIALLAFQVHQTACIKEGQMYKFFYDERASGLNHIEEKN